MPRDNSDNIVILQASRNNELSDKKETVKYPVSILSHSPLHERVSPQETKRLRHCERKIFFWWLIRPRKICSLVVMKVAMQKQKSQQMEISPKDGDQYEHLVDVAEKSD